MENRDRTKNEGGQGQGGGQKPGGGGQKPGGGERQGGGGQKPGGGEREGGGGQKPGGGGRPSPSGVPNEGRDKQRQNENSNQRLIRPLDDETKSTV